MYWDMEHTADYQCLFNFIMGIRGCGKTYTSLKTCIKWYLKSLTNKISEPQRFLYLRRRKTELDDLTSGRKETNKLFAKVQSEFSGVEIYCEGNVLYCNDEVMGWAQSLSTATARKSIPYPGVRNIIFDEFVIDDTGNYKYLKDETIKFFEFYETVSRDSDPRVWFLANALSQVNPYFVEFNIYAPSQGIKRFGKNKDILVEMVAPEDMIERKKNTRFGQLIEGSSYEGYAVENKWLMDSNALLGKKPRSAKYYCTLHYNDKNIGIWIDPKTQCLYASFNVDLQCPHEFACTDKDHKANINLIRNMRTIPYLRTISTMFDHGALLCENLEIKNYMFDIMRRR